MNNPIAETGRAPGQHEPDGADSTYAWWRLVASALVGLIGNVGMWSVVVVLPAVQKDFGIARADASLPYTVTLFGFAAGGILMGRLADRHGIRLPLLSAVVFIFLGYVLAGYAENIWQFTLAQGLFIGLLGASGTFAPIIADISHWFRRYRGIAVALCASGNYAAGAVWPPIVQWGVEAYGWRNTYIGLGVVVSLAILPLALALRRPSPVQGGGTPTIAAAAGGSRGTLGYSPTALQVVLIAAGLSCCIAMSMPQVHIVAYCADLGYGPARGAEMLALMLGFGVISRIGFGLITDRIGGLMTLLIGSVLQMVALALYLPYDSLVSLYVISALFGLFQGGIVPAYAIIVREYFPPKEAGARVGAVLMSTLGGMAIGGWLTGLIYDYTGSYQAAIVNGVAFNALNILIVGWLILRARGGRATPAPAAA